jgi:hypothetical protein
MKGVWGRECIASVFPNLCTGRMCVVSITPRPHFTPDTHFTGGWVCPSAGWVQRVEEKFSASVWYRTPIAQSVATRLTTDKYNCRKRVLCDLYTMFVNNCLVVWFCLSLSPYTCFIFETLRGFWWNLALQVRSCICHRNLISVCRSNINLTSTFFVEEGPHRRNW